MGTNEIALNQVANGEFCKECCQLFTQARGLETFIEDRVYKTLCISRDHATCRCGNAEASAHWNRRGPDSDE